MIMQKGVEKGALLAPSPARFQLKSTSGLVKTWGFFLPPIFLSVSLLFEFFEFLCVITLTMLQVCFKYSRSRMTQIRKISVCSLLPL